MKLLEDFLNECERKCIDDGNNKLLEHYASYQRHDYEKVMRYATETAEIFFNNMNKKKEQDKVKLLKQVIDESYFNKEKVKDKDLSNIFRAVAIGCLSTIAEKTQYDALKNLGFSDDEIPIFDVPEYTDYVGIFAGSEKRNARFRFVKMGFFKKPGRPGFESGKFGYTFVEVDPKVYLD
jgi:hypothetical protein